MIGEQDQTQIGEDGMSGKQRKAYAMTTDGSANIHFLDESAFFSMVPASAVPAEATLLYEKRKAGERTSQTADLLQKSAEKVHTGARRDGISLSSYEEAAVSEIIASVGDLAASIHVERRSSNYLTVTVSERRLDFCRIKASDRTLWMPLDTWTGNFPKDDPRLIGVGNKNQRHWKINLASVDDIVGYSDLILLSAL